MTRLNLLFVFPQLLLQFVHSGIQRVAFEPDHVTVILREQLEAMVEVEWVSFPMLVETHRCCKDAEEIEAIRGSTTGK